MNSFTSALRRYVRILSLLVLSLLVVTGCCISPANANGVVGTISSGQIVYGTVTTTGVDTYSFYVPASGSFYVSMSETGTHDIHFDPSVTLTTPSGGYYGGFGSGYYAADVVTGAAGGTWKVNAQRYGGIGTTGGTYALTVVVAPSYYSVSAGQAGGSMTPNQTYAGSNFYGSADTYTVNGIAGTGHTVTLTVNKTSTGTYLPEVAVFSPSGGYIGRNYGSSYTYTFSTAAASGPYMAIMYRYYGGITVGTYTLSGSGTGMATPIQGNGDGSTCIACEAAKKSAAAGGQPPPQSGGVASNGATATP
jgi:hypothetical protein